MNRRIGKLSLIITLYKPNDIEKRYWFSFYKRYRSKIRIFFLVDGTNIEFDDYISKEDIYVGKKNKGKFKLVYDFIKEGNVKTPYFKIVDPDDYILFNYIKDSYFGEGEDILFLPILRGKEIKRNHNINLWFKSIITRKKYWKSNFGNSYTVYPTKYIKNDSLIEKDWDIPIHDDQVIGFICLGNGAGIGKIKKPFYYYNEFNGVTNNDNIDIILEKAIKTFKVISMLNQKSKIERYSDWPFDYIWYINKIEKSIFSDNKEARIKLYRKIDLLKEIDIYKHLD